MLTNLANPAVHRNKLVCEFTDWSIHRSTHCCPLQLWCLVGFQCSWMCWNIIILKASRATHQLLLTCATNSRSKTTLSGCHSIIPVARSTTLASSSFIIPSHALGIALASDQRIFWNYLNEFVFISLSLYIPLCLSSRSSPNPISAQAIAPNTKNPTMNNLILFRTIACWLTNDWPPTPLNHPFIPQTPSTFLG